MRDKREFNSQLDPKAVIAEDSIAVTLIRDTRKEFGILPPEHALLVIEEVIDNKYEVHITDLVNPYTHFQGIEAVVKNHWGHENDKSKVRWFTPHDGIVQCSEKSHTWVVSRKKADLMLNEIHDEVDKKKKIPPFYMLGGKSLLTYFSMIERNGEMPLNCIHWALNKLRLAGINLYQGSFNIATDTALYTKNDNRYHLNPYGMTELCDFIKLGKIEAIRRFFPPQTPNVDLNKCTWGDVGPVELQLRNYTPLMLACGYGRWDIAKMLINEYGADVNVKTERGLTWNVFRQWLFLSYNALECAEHERFGLTKISKEDNATKEEVINLIKEKMHQRELPQNLSSATLSKRN